MAVKIEIPQLRRSGGAFGRALLGGAIGGPEGAIAAAAQGTPAAGVLNLKDIAQKGFEPPATKKIFDFQRPSVVEITKNNDSLGGRLLDERESDAFIRRIKRLGGF